mmetsp:Transcript_17480/g.27260  ORF Transcript_17480/g.27260 Transcript_17480/m.27260 type:complete len:92 (-) Transcript_17480:656-931(-)
MCGQTTLLQKKCYRRLNGQSYYSNNWQQPHPPPALTSRASSASAAEEGMPQHRVLRCILYYSQLIVAMGSPPWWPRGCSLPVEADHLIINK